MFRSKLLPAVLLASFAFAQSGSPQEQAARIRAAMEPSLRMQKQSVARQLEAVSLHHPRVVESAPLTARSVVDHWSTPRFNCPPVPAERLASDIESAATENGVSPDVIRAVAWAESAFVPCAISRTGAQGIMQIMPATGRYLGLANPMDPTQSISAGAKYLRELLTRYGGDLRLALSAYNAGPALVDKYQEIPPIPETQNYVLKILGNMRADMPVSLSLGGDLSAK